MEDRRINYSKKRLQLHKCSVFIVVAHFSVIYYPLVLEYLVDN